MGRYDHIGRYFQYCIKWRGKNLFHLSSIFIGVKLRNKQGDGNLNVFSKQIMSYLIYSENFMWKWKKISLSLSIVESLMLFPVVGLTWFCHCCNNLPKVYCHWNNFTMLFAFVSRHVDIFIIWCNNCLEFYLLNFQAPWPLWSALALKGTWNPFGV